MHRNGFPVSRVSAEPRPLTQLALALVLSAVLALPTVVLGAGGLPGGLPDLQDPRILADWQPHMVGNLKGDPDFPLVLYLNKSSNGPAAVMVAIDARNGTSRWSLASDPVIAIAVFADPQTVTRLYFDEGFAEDGRPSGQYALITGPDSDALSAFLKWAAHLQHRVYM